MRVRRDISSIPQRSASETWQRIVDLVTGSESRDVDQLRRAAGTLASIITDEHPAVQPIVLEGAGPQLRIYCQYGQKAIEGGNSVAALAWNPTDGDWTMHVPCDSENLGWVRASLSTTSPRIKVFNVTKEPDAGDDSASTSAMKTAIVVDWNPRG